jgi:hypothetical protein
MGHSADAEEVDCGAEKFPQRLKRAPFKRQLLQHLSSGITEGDMNRVLYGVRVVDRTVNEFRRFAR